MAGETLEHARLILRNSASKFRVADDRSENVVAAVRDASEYSTQRFHFLRVTQLLCKRELCIGETTRLGHIPLVRDHTHAFAVDGLRLGGALEGPPVAEFDDVVHRPLR